MKRKFLFVAILCGLLGACAPQNQISLIDDKKPELQETKQSCAESTSGEDNPHRSAAICTFDAWGTILKDSSFQDMDLLYDYRARIVNISTQWDRGTLTKEKAELYFKDAHNQFTYGVQRRDAERTRRYTSALIAAGQGLNQVQYTPPPPMPSYAPVSQPSMPPMMPVDTALQDNYLREIQASQPPQPSIAQRLRDCSQAPGGCNGAFAR